MDAIEKIYKAYWELEEILVDIDGIAHNLLEYDDDSFTPAGVEFLHLVQKQSKQAREKLQLLEAEIIENEQRGRIFGP